MSAYPRILIETPEQDTVWALRIVEYSPDHFAFEQKSLDLMGEYRWEGLPGYSFLWELCAALSAQKDKNES